APDSPPMGLDGWAYMMRTADKDLAMLYFENQAALPTLSGFLSSTLYNFQWFNPRNGEWQAAKTIKTDRRGNLNVPPFPDGNNPSATDWAAKISIVRKK
ncbi:MAG: putative collagen-binding domain-containing protein, partial [Candidatus Neomarinimicrobiota bacterium]